MFDQHTENAHPNLISPSPPFLNISPTQVIQASSTRETLMLCQHPLLRLELYR
jgi:hypothetical protein